MNTTGLVELESHGSYTWDLDVVADSKALHGYWDRFLDGMIDADFISGRGATKEFINSVKWYSRYVPSVTAGPHNNHFGFTGFAGLNN